MLRRLIMAPIKSALAPLFVVLSAFRTIKTAILKLIGGSRTAASAAASATSTASDVAKNASETGSNTQESSPEPGSDSIDSLPSETATQLPDADAQAQFDRFGTLYAAYAGYVFVATILSLTVLTSATIYLSMGDIIRITLFATAPIAVVAVIARAQRKVTWMIAFGLTFLFLFGRILSLIDLAPLGVVTPSPGLDRPLLFLISLGEFAFLGSILGAGWKGRHTVLSTASDDHIRPEHSASGGDSGTETSSSSHSPSDSVTTDGSIENPAPEAPSSSKQTDASVSAESGAAGPTSEVEPIAQETGDASDSEVTDNGTNTETESTGVEATLANVDTDDVDAETVRSIGSELPSDRIPDRVFDFLRRHADADDPDIRLAVAEICAELEDERTDEILRNRRIDPDNRVVNVAVSALN
ncbi:HEAT repeat domain-containing protein [Halapricum desulfuricans]|nr:HEAT repeat domain-containing protein [Halapricum desulfuricans]